MDPKGGRDLEAAGVIDSKFGPVTLLRHPGDADARACLGFIRRLDEAGPARATPCRPGAPPSAAF